MRVLLTVCFLLLLIGTSLAKHKNGKRKKHINGKVIQTCVEENCNKLCRTRQHEKTPFCGSDNVTYKTRCDFCMAKCRASGEGITITIKSRNSCKKTKTKHLLKKIRKMNRKQKKGPKMAKKCPSSNRCTSTANSVCSSNNVTYTSMCLFRVAQCHARKSGGNLTVQYRGSCGSKKECPKLEQCKIVPRTFPVCASNLVTYPSHCHFRVAACEAREKNQKFRMLYRGKCGKTAIKPRSKCSNLQCNGQKPKPVCGSDKKTYNNTCEFQLAKCALKKKRSELKLAYHGVCGAKKQSKRCRNIVPCKHKNMPVCGTDGKQYESPCHLQEANCELPKDVTIKIKNRGRCV